MAVDWAEVNENRIGEKTQEILLYCAQKKSIYDHMCIRSCQAVVWSAYG